MQSFSSEELYFNHYFLSRNIFFNLENRRGENMVAVIRALVATITAVVTTADGEEKKSK
jgi:hypothetical protein